MDRKRYAWTIDGIVKAGTLQEYANDLRNAELAGESGMLTKRLWNGVDFDTPEISQSDWDEDDWAYVTVRVQLDAEGNEDVATFRIDGRG